MRGLFEIYLGSGNFSRKEMGGNGQKEGPNCGGEYAFPSRSEPQLTTWVETTGGVVEGPVGERSVQRPGVILPQIK